MTARRMLVALGLAAAAAAWSATARASDQDHIAPVAAPLRAQATFADSAYDLKVIKNNLLAVSVTNYGFVGNNYVSASPSLEYPLGTRFEHMVRGGLWVGAHNNADDFFGVTTGALDGAVGSVIKNSTEFAPKGREIRLRSTLKNDKHFVPPPGAVSEQDYVGEYDDLASTKSDFNSEPHHPLGILVRQENYVWSYSDLKHFVIFHYVIKNVGDAPLDSVFTGFYAELASGRGPYHSPWFNKKWVSWDESDSMFREHYCNSGPLPTGCNYSYVPPWIGIKILGGRDRNDATNQRLKPGQLISVGAWTYAPGDPARAADVQRYAIMASGARPDTTSADLSPGTGDPAEMIAIGPFRQIDKGDSICFDIALVGGDDIAQIRKHAAVAQRAFDNNYIVPRPPDPPLIKLVPREGAIDIYWENSPESTFDPTSPNPRDFEGYRVYLGENQLAPTLQAQFDVPGDTASFNTGFDRVKLTPPVKFEGDTVIYNYKYTVSGLRDGFKYYAAVTSFDTGTPEFESLESGLNLNLALAFPGATPGEKQASGRGVTVFPNPYRVEARWDQGKLARDHYLWFANLPERCTLRIYTLSGDLVFDTEIDGRNYHGEGSRGVYDPQRDIGVAPPTLGGTSYAWNLISREGEAVATGLYLYSVEDHAGGKRTVGKFLIVKSDREQF